MQTSAYNMFPTGLLAALNYVLFQDPAPFVEFCASVRKSHGNHTKPLLVQSESGSDRAAIFIAVDILSAQYLAENQVNEPFSLEF